MNVNGSTDLFLADLNRIQEKLSTASRQISSGKKIFSPSDAPDEIGPLLQIRAELQRNDQISANLELEKADALTADAAIASAIKLMDRARALAAQAANQAALTDTVRQSVAVELESIQQQMVAFSRTAMAGRFVFGGDQALTPPYELNLAEPNGATRLTDAAATRRVEDPAGGSFPASLTAQEIFDKRNEDGTFAPGNVFAALNTLRTALLANDEDGIEASTDALQLAGDHLNSAESFYGKVELRIRQAQKYAEERQTQLKTRLSEKEDADVVAAALDLATANTHLQAMLQMRAKVRSSSLFDYLA